MHETMTQRKKEAGVTENPEAVILKLYDLGIQKSQAQDQDGVQKVLTELMASLNFDYKEMAGSFYDLYEYALTTAGSNNFDQVLFVLQGLHSAWEQLITAKEDKPVPA